MKRQIRTVLSAALGLAIAAGAALVMTTAAEASPAFTRVAVKVFMGAGSTSSVIGQLPAGARVDVRQCYGAWCEVNAEGDDDGWVESQFLVGTLPPATPVEPPAAPQPPSGPVEAPPVNPNPGNPGGFTFDFGFNVNPGNPPPPNFDDDEPVFSDGEACFYSRTQYRGSSFCLEAGDQLRDLGDWTDQISSIENRDGLDVTVCTRTRLRGDCRTYTGNAKSLGDFDDDIASISID
jgi:hypothetical protein